MKKLLWIMLAAVVFVPPTARTAQAVGFVSARSSDAALAEIRPTFGEPRISSGLRPAENARLGSTAVLSRLPMGPTTASSAGVVYRIAGIRGETARLLGIARADLDRYYAIAPIPNSLGAGLWRIYSGSTVVLRGMADFYAKIVAGDVTDVKMTDITGAVRAQESIALDGVWLFKFCKANRYELTNRLTGDVIIVWDDPHIGGRGNEFYANWSSALMLFVLPGEDPNFPTLVLARSTGGTENDGYGYPTQITSLSKKQWVHVAGLNGSPTGIRGEGAMFVRQGLEQDLRSAHLLYWVAEAKGELRTQTGERSNPPDSAKTYERKAPGRVIDPIKQYDNLRLVTEPADARIPVADQEVMERVRQAKSAMPCPIAGVKDRADAYLTNAQAYGKETHDYLVDRIGLLDEFEQVVKRLEQIEMILKTPDLRPDEAEKLRQEREKLRARIAELKPQLEKKRPSK